MTKPPSFPYLRQALARALAIGMTIEEARAIILDAVREEQRAFLVDAAYDAARAARRDDEDARELRDIASSPGKFHMFAEGVR